MAQIFYELDDSSTSTNYVYYTTSYNDLKNETTVTFQPTWHKIFQEYHEVIVKTVIKVTATDSGASGSASTSFKVSGFGPANSGGRDFYDPTPSPQSVVVKHGTASGAKSVKISASTTKGNYYGSGSATVKTGTHTYGAASTPKSIALNYKNGSSFQKITTFPYSTYRDTTLKITWKAATQGDNNPISKYKIIYTDLDTKATSTITTSSSSTEYEFVIKDSFKKPNKKSRFQLQIQTISTYGDGTLDSSKATVGGEIKLINKPPAAPPFTLSGLLRITGDPSATSTITINNLDSKDVDGDSLTYYYRLLDTNGNGIGKEAQLKGNTISMSRNTPSIMIRAYDGEAYGPYTTVTAKKNGSLSGEIIWSDDKLKKINSKNNSRIYINKILELKSTHKKTGASISAYNWQIKGNTQTYSGQSISSVSLPPTREGGDQLINISLKITDTIGDSWTFNKTLDYYRTSIKTISSLIPVSEEKHSGNIGDIYLNDLLSFKTNFTQSDADVQNKFEFYKIYGDNKEVKLNTTNPDVSNNSSTSYGIYDAKLSGDGERIEYKFKVRLLNAFGEEAAVFITDKTYELLPLYTVNNFSVSKTEWHPLPINKNEELKFTTSYLNSDVYGENFYTISASYAVSGNIYNYSLADHIQKISEDTQNFRVEYTEGSDTISFAVNNKELFKKLMYSTEYGDTIVTFRITGYNAYQRKGNTLKFNVKLVAWEKPFFDNVILNAAVIGVDSTGEDKWFNPTDVVNFTLDEGSVIDYNDSKVDATSGEIEETPRKTVINYELVYAYIDEYLQDSPENTPWKKLQNGDFISNNDYLSKIEAPMPDLSKKNSKTEVLIALRVKDNKNYYSNYLVMNYSLFACRMTTPQINIKSASYQENNNQLKISLNLSSIDLGGNNFGAENFTRNGTEKFQIKFYYSKDNDDFVEDQDDFVEGKNSQLKLVNGFFDIPATFVVSKPQSQEENKIYIKAVITINTNNINKQIIATSPTYLLYLASPTVSHRAHWVGINTIENGTEDVFHVSSFEAKNKIRLTGFSNNAEKILIINLDTGEVSGAIINGGTW